MSYSLPPDYDKTLGISETNPAPAQPGPYLWEVPGKPVAIYLELDVVDRMLQDVMRGFGAVPRRGAEVGGILLGKSVTGEKLRVEVDGYEVVPIEYRLGPSFLLSDADRQAFEATLDRLRASGQQTGSVPVGFFRSQTRDAEGLVPEDIELLDTYFPDDDKIVLLIKPFASRVSTAGFYFREDGKFPTGPPLNNFNFRRKDLGGGEPAPLPPPAPLIGSEDVPAAGRARARRPEVSSVAVDSLRDEPTPTAPISNDNTPPSSSVTPVQRHVLVGWVWLPLSAMFLLLGVLLGYQASLMLRPVSPPGDAFVTGLSVTAEGANLNVRWNRQAPAIRAATQGVLGIYDGPNSRSVNLTADQLQTGSGVVYAHNTGEVRFRLELTLPSRTALIERLDWNE